MLSIYNKQELNAAQKFRSVSDAFSVKNEEHFRANIEPIKEREKKQTNAIVTVNSIVLFWLNRGQTK